MNCTWVILAALLWVLPAQAQFKSGARFGDANGFSAPVAASGGGGYVGPLDAVSGAVAYWGLRCSTTAYAGNVADIWDSATDQPPKRSSRAAQAAP